MGVGSRCGRFHPTRPREDEPGRATCRRRRTLPSDEDSRRIGNAGTSAHSRRGSTLTFPTAPGVESSPRGDRVESRLVRP